MPSNKKTDMRKPIVIGNWKMQLDLSEARRLMLEIKAGLTDVKDEDIDIVVCPSFLHLSMIRYQLSPNIKLGAQDLFWKDRGAYTGAVSGLQLSDVGVNYVIVGHSERRVLFRETDQEVNRKIQACLKNNLVPVICVGENLEERKGGETQNVVLRQLKIALSTINLKEPNQIIIAYEPVWAIGRGKPVQALDAQEVAQSIRRMLNEKYNTYLAERIRILYGGSVDAQTISEFVRQIDIDGSLVGGASLKAYNFIGIVKNTILATQS